MAPRLEAAGVSKRFGTVAALTAVDLRVQPGEVHALIGENGAGKSTLVKVLSGAHHPDSGVLELDGRPYRPEGPLAARRSGVAMIYQELTLAPQLSVEQNVMLGCEWKRRGLLRKAAMRGAVRAALDFLGHPELEPGTPVAELGPGAKQLVEIARALVGEARLVVLDEPTSSLSRPDVERLFGVIARLREKGVAIVYISHFLEEIERIADRYTVLRDGRSVASGEVAETSIATWLEQMAGRELGEHFPRVAHAPGEVLLEVEELGREPLPRLASLVLRRGEILGIAGLVGAGRTELLRALFGLAPAQRGRIRLAGRPLAPGGPRSRLARGVGLLSEDRKEEGLALSLSIAENLTLSRLSPYLRHGCLDVRARSRATHAWMESLGIRARSSEQRIGELSGGNQQKVALARLLHHDVDLLLLDEPTRGIDIASKVEIYRCLGELAARGKAILIVSSYLPELLGICDRIAVMHRGRLGPARAVEQWTETALLDEATRGAHS